MTRRVPFHLDIFASYNKVCFLMRCASDSNNYFNNFPDGERKIDSIQLDSRISDNNMVNVMFARGSSSHHRKHKNTNALVVLRWIRTIVVRSRRDNLDLNDKVSTEEGRPVELLLYTFFQKLSWRNFFLKIFFRFIGLASPQNFEGPRR